MRRLATALVAAGLAAALLTLILVALASDGGGGGGERAATSSFALGPDELVADHKSFDISPDRRQVSVVTSDPVVEGCTEPVDLHVEVLADVVVLRPVFRRLPEGGSCEEACDRHTMSARLDEPIPADVTVVFDPDRAGIC